VPMLTPSATNPRITQIGDYIFRVCFLDEFQGRVIARFAHDRLKVQKLAILTDVKQDYSVDLARFLGPGGRRGRSASSPARGSTRHGAI
jgi:branched-chain amino acid transport system substrate-binding protein